MPRSSVVNASDVAVVEGTVCDVMTGFAPATTANVLDAKVSASRTVRRFTPSVREASGKRNVASVAVSDSITTGSGTEKLAFVPVSGSTRYVAY